MVNSPATVTILPWSTLLQGFKFDGRRGAHPALAFPRPQGKRSPEDILRLIEMEAGFDEIDQYLSKMTPDHLDRAVAAAGFDPAMETRRGIGMREKVVMAIAARRADEE
jgi:hypothetical protein